MRERLLLMKPLVSSENSCSNDQRARNQGQCRSNFVSLDLEADRFTDIIDGAARYCGPRFRECRSWFTSRHYGGPNLITFRSNGTIELVLKLEFLLECL